MPRLGMSGPPVAPGRGPLFTSSVIAYSFGRAMDVVRGSFQAPPISSGSLAAKL
jgi:hypothetical protein